MSMWRGEEKLWKVFWGGLFFPLVFGIVAGFVAAIFHLRSELHSFISGFGFVVFNFIYTLVWASIVWKCRHNSSSSAWKWLALLVVLIGILVSIAGVIGKINPTSLASYNPVCIKTLEDFAKQNNLDPQKYIQGNQLYLLKCTKEFYRNTCIRTMEDFARQNKLNSEDYIKQNQSYLSQCSQSLEDNAAASHN